MFELLGHCCSGIQLCRHPINHASVLVGTDVGHGKFVHSDGTVLSVCEIIKSTPSRYCCNTVTLLYRSGSSTRFFMEPRVDVQ
jgi:hypothetical protein